MASMFATMAEKQPVAAGTVLVVDDDPSTLDFLKSALQDVGYKVLTAVDGEAQYAARLTPPDVILLDIRMLGMDGVAVCRSLRSDPSTADIPIIAMSAQHRLDSTAPAMPINDWLPKPIDLARLYATVARWVKNP